MRRFSIPCLLTVAAVSVIVSALFAPTANAQNRYTAGTTLAAITWEPVAMVDRHLTRVSTTSDKATSDVIIQVGEPGIAPTTLPENTDTVIAIDNSDGYFSNSDSVAVIHPDGTWDVTTVSANTTSNITLAAGVSKDALAGTKVFKLETVSVNDVGNATLHLTADPLVFVPAGRPLRVYVDGTSACRVMGAVVRAP